MKIVFLIGIGFGFLALGGCSGNFPDYPASAPFTMTINAPSDYLSCVTKRNGTIPISVDINIISRFFDPANGGRLTTFSDVNIVNLSSNSFPLIREINVPATGQYDYLVTMVASTNQCADCANGFSLPLEKPQYGNCPSTEITPGQYLAARPRWSAGAIVRVYVSSTNIAAGNFTRIPNVPFSCGCTVSL